MNLPVPKSTNLIDYWSDLSKFSCPKGANQHFSGRSKLWARPKSEMYRCRVWDHKKSEGNDIEMGLKIARSMIESGKVVEAEKTLKSLEECNRESSQELSLDRVAMVVGQYQAQWRKG